MPATKPDNIHCPNCDRLCRVGLEHPCRGKITWIWRDPAGVLLSTVIDERF